MIFYTTRMIKIRCNGGYSWIFQLSVIKICIQFIIKRQKLVFERKYEVVTIVS